MSTEQNPESRPRLLIVDDSRMVRASIIKHLKGLYDIREEGDGEAAWQTLVLDHHIDAVISDLSMPVMDGFQVCQILKSNPVTKDMKIIAISGKKLTPAQQDFLKKNCDRFLQKPFEMADLVGAVDKLFPN